MKAPMKQRLKVFWKKSLRPLLVCILVVTAVRSAIADWNDVPTGSMTPTIRIGDRS